MMNKQILIHEKSRAGRIGTPMPEPSRSEKELLNFIPMKYRRDVDAPMPEVNEV